MREAIKNNLGPLLCLLFSLSGSAYQIDKKVLGNDTRAQIHYTQDYRYQSIGHVGTYCTGTLIARNIVLTAAHCVFDKKEKVLQKTAYFRPARNGDGLPFGQYNWEKIYIPRGYKKDGEKSLDFAFIKLKKEIYNISYARNYKIPKKKEEIQIIGYPGDKDFATMWESHCRSDIAEKGWLHYSCDTFGGMSGSAIWSYYKGNRVIVGIHTLGDDEFNKGVSFNPFILKEIKKITSSKSLSTNEWAIYKNKYQYFLDEFDKIIFSNNTNHTISVEVIYGDLKKKIVTTTKYISRVSRSKMIKTRKSSFMFRYKMLGKTWPDRPNSKCKGKGLKLHEDKCYFKSYIKGANWKTFTVDLPHSIK